MPSPAWIATALAGKVLSGVEVADDDEIDRLRVKPGRASAARAAAIAEIGGRFAVGRDVALADAGALHDPFVGCVDHPRQFVVGEGALRQIAAAAEDDGTCDSHEAASTLLAAASSLAWRTTVSRILLSSS